MKTILFQIVIALTLLTSSAYSQNKVSTKATYLLTLLDSAEVMPDSIGIGFWPTSISGNYGRQVIYEKPDISGKIRFTLPKINGTSIFHIHFLYKDKNIWSEKYFFENGDDILIKFSRRGTNDMILEFGGKQKLKYEIVNLLQYESKQFYEGQMKYHSINFGNGFMQDDSKKLEALCQPEILMRYVDKLAKAVDSNANATRQILMKFRNSLSPDLIEFYQNEYNNSYLFTWFVSLLYNRKDIQPACRLALAEHYFAKVPAFEVGSNKYLWHNHKLITVLGFQKAFESLVMNDGAHYPFQYHYQRLKDVKNEILKERLIGSFFIENSSSIKQYVSNNEARDSCLKDALTFVKNPKLKLALTEELLFSKGSFVFDFSLPDTSGMLVTKESLKGKVFLIDFYGEGCAGCAYFFNMFASQVHPVFKDNKDFKTLSVNIDNTKERWLKAMKSGLYTNQSHINLNTGKVGANHPMLKYYNLNSVPLVLLIDKQGSLVARITNFTRPEEIRKMIEKALEEKID